MRSSLSLLLLLALLAAMPSPALPEPGGSGQEAGRDEILRQNRQLLKKWQRDPDHAARLERDLATFWALASQRRQRLRKLDRDLHQLDSATRQRLWGVLERYHAWLKRLPEEQRRRINSASDWQERLRIVKDLREQEWLQRQPKAVRASVAGLSASQRSQRVTELRAEQRRRLKLALTPFRPEPRKLSDFPVDVRLFVQFSLRPLLTPEERRQLDQTERKPWPLYARTLASLAEKHPLPLPGPIGPVRIADLPEKLRENIHNHPRWEAALKRQEGKWPEFGVALLYQPGRKKPRPVGRFMEKAMPARLEDCSEAVRLFATTGPLGKALSPAEKEELKKAEGKWPDYPKTLLKLARKHNLTLPGMTLPGPKELWDRARAPRLD
jgi:hypothetical protein